MNIVFTLGKVLLVMLWTLAALALLLPAMGAIDSLLIKAAVITLAIHLLELAWVDKRLRPLANPWAHRLQVLLFGYFHWGQLGRV